MEELFTLPLYGALPGITLSQRLLEALSHPERARKIVHVAGTNGKGTTCSYAASMLMAAGYRVGLLTSPHLCRMNERIRVDGRPIGDEDLSRLVGDVLAVRMDDAPTLSDVLLAAALLFFREQGCDYVILETGLGGRLDSTNAIEEIPLVTAITGIGIEHTAILGKSLQEIAQEKAGIIKRGTTLVLAETDEAAARVIRQRADALAVPVIEAKRSEAASLFPAIEVYAKGQGISYDAGGRTIGELKESYLASNIITAAAIVRTLLWALPEDVAARGVLCAPTDGRLEVAGRKSAILFDGAHNPQGARALVGTLRAWHPKESFVFVIGCLAREDIEELLGAFLPVAKHIVAVDVAHEKNYGAKQIAEFYHTRGVRAVTANDLTDDKRQTSEDAVLHYIREQGIHTRIVICGSLYLYRTFAPFLKDGSDNGWR